MYKHNKHEKTFDVETSIIVSSVSTRTTAYGNGKYFSVYHKVNIALIN